MIQDIGRNTIDTEFAKPKPQDSDYVLIFEKTDEFVVPETGSLPTYADWKRLGGNDSELVHIFEQAGTQFFTVLDPDDAIKQQLRREVSRYLRTVQPTWLRLGSVTALHLFQWFQNHRFCGCCGAPMKPDGKELAMRCEKVIAVEIDTTLKPILEETLAEFDNVEIVFADVMETDLAALLAEKAPGMEVVVCANLPYYITSPVIMRVLESRLPVSAMTVMVQKEAADRLAAAPGTRASSAISCAVSYYATSKLMFTAAPGSFYPAPKVTSAVVRMEIRPTPAVQVEDEEGYFALVRAAFGQRRKTAANAIASGLGMPKDAVTAAIEAAGFDARIRPEALTLEDFAKIQQALA